MKVLFLQDVRPTAMAGDVKEVKNGYGRNYLIPNNLAVLATRDELQRADKLRKAAEDRRLKEAQDWQEIASSLTESPIEVEVRTGPTGRLYGSVTSTMIAEKIAELIDREVNRRNIRIPAPIRTTGLYTVEAKFAGGVDANLEGFSRVRLGIERDVVRDQGDGGRVCRGGSPGIAGRRCW